jgi:hypothetical protein
MLRTFNTATTLKCLAVFMTFAVVGCGNPAPVNGGKNSTEERSLVKDLKARGVTYLNTTKIVVRGNEGSVGRNITFSESAPFFVQEVWDRIHQSRPYSVWAASGYGEVEFYTSDDPAAKPAAVLMLNETDEAHFISQTAKEGYRCPGLHEYLGVFLRHEYERKCPASLPANPGPSGK